MKLHMEFSRVCVTCRKCAYCYVLTTPHDCDLSQPLYHDHPDWNRIPWRGPRIASHDAETLRRLIESGRA